MRIHDVDVVLSDATNPVTPLAMTGTQYSKPLRCGAGSKASFHGDFSGTLVTAVTVWTTNKPDRDRADATDADWVQETSITVTPVPAGAATKFMLHLADLASELVRLKFVTSGGAGNGKVWGKVGE